MAKTILTLDAPPKPTVEYNNKLGYGPVPYATHPKAGFGYTKLIEPVSNKNFLNTIRRLKKIVDYSLKHRLYMYRLDDRIFSTFFKTQKPYTNQTDATTHIILNSLNQGECKALCQAIGRIVKNAEIRLEFKDINFTKKLMSDHLELDNVLMDYCTLFDNMTLPYSHKIAGAIDFTSEMDRDPHIDHPPKELKDIAIILRRIPRQLHYRIILYPGKNCSTKLLLMLSRMVGLPIGIHLRNWRLHKGEINNIKELLGSIQPTWKAIDGTPIIYMHPLKDTKTKKYKKFVSVKQIESLKGEPYDIMVESSKPDVNIIMINEILDRKSKDTHEQKT